MKFLENKDLEHKDGVEGRLATFAPVLFSISRNFTDSESRIMKSGSSFEQGYNVQAAVDLDTMLIVGNYVTTEGNDKEQLQPIVQAISAIVGTPEKVIADTDYFSATAIKAIEDNGHGPPLYVAVGQQSHSCNIHQLEDHLDPQPPHPPVPASKKPWPTASQQKPEKRSINCAKKPSNPPSVSSKKRWASVVSRSEAKAKSAP